MNNPETQATGTRNRTNSSKAKQKQNKKDEQRGLNRVKPRCTQRLNDKYIVRGGDF